MRSRKGGEGASFPREGQPYESINSSLEIGNYEGLNIPGHIATYVYRSDADPNVVFMAVVFASRDAYMATANSPEQDQRYRQMRALLASDPEWHDGEVVAVAGR